MLLILTLFLVLMLIIFIMYLYFISRRKKQAIQVFTLESFINAKHFDETVSQKKSLLDIITDYLDDDDNDNDGGSDSFDTGDGDDGGE